MHDSYHVVQSGYLLLCDVSVSQEDNSVVASFDDSVDEVIAVDVTDKGYRAFLQV